MTALAVTVIAAASVAASPASGVSGGRYDQHSEHDSCCYRGANPILHRGLSLVLVCRFRVIQRACTTLVPSEFVVSGARLSGTQFRKLRELPLLDRLRMGRLWNDTIAPIPDLRRPVEFANGDPSRLVDNAGSLDVRRVHRPCSDRIWNDCRLPYF